MRSLLFGDPEAQAQVFLVASIVVALLDPMWGVPSVLIVGLPPRGLAIRLSKECVKALSLKRCAVAGQRQNVGRAVRPALVHLRGDAFVAPDDIRDDAPAARFEDAVEFTQAPVKEGTEGAAKKQPTP